MQPHPSELLPMWQSAIVAATVLFTAAVPGVLIIRRFLSGLTHDAEAWLWRGTAVAVIVVPLAGMTLFPWTTDLPGLDAASGGGIARVLLTLWLAGVSCHLYRLWTHIQRHRQTCRDAEWPHDPEIRAQARELAARFSLPAVPEVLISNTAPSPSVIGRTVLIPAESFPLAARNERVAGPLALRACLAHEFAHIYRKDGWWSWWRIAVEICLWFHPFVWRGQFGDEWTLAQEAATDRDALEVSGIPAGDYGRLLEHFARRQQCAAETIGMTQVARTILGRRIALLASPPPGVRAWRVVVLCLGLAVLSEQAITTWRSGMEREVASTNRLAPIEPVGLTGYDGRQDAVIIQAKGLSEPAPARTKPRPDAPILAWLPPYKQDVRLWAWLDATGKLELCDFRNGWILAHWLDTGLDGQEQEHHGWVWGGHLEALSKRGKRTIPAEEFALPPSNLSLGAP